MHNYILLKATKKDFAEIVSYTDEKWSETQTQKYIKDLKQCFSDIANGHVVVRAFEGIQGVYSILCNGHYVFYMKGDPLKIIGIIHTSRDIMRHLKGRV